jgi:hypothetical protein
MYGLYFVTFARGLRSGPSTRIVFGTTQLLLQSCLALFI